MYRNEDCQCGEVHECEKCVPEHYAVWLAQKVGLTFIVVMMHKGHYLRWLRNGEHEGIGGPTLALWHALIEMDRQWL